MLATDVQRMVEVALAEDLGYLPANEGDITASLIPQEQQATANIITREACIFVGKAWLTEVFAQLDEQTNEQTLVNWHVEDGDKLKPNDLICSLSGNARVLLTGERAALNFIQSLSGTATLVSQYVEKLKHTNTKLLDTRKTIPGLRTAQKYAVKCGGGENHRIGLFDAYLIKENHIAACGGIENAVSKAKSNHPAKLVEIEVESLNELQLALDAGTDIIMLDNFTIPMIKQAVELTKVERVGYEKAKLEVSGNMNFETIADYASTGVDYVSCGALTKHVQAIDLSMRFVSKV